MRNIPEEYEYGDARVFRIIVDFEKGKPTWTCQVHIGNGQTQTGWVGSGGWASPMEALEFELDIAKQRALRQE